MARPPRRLLLELSAFTPTPATLLALAPVSDDNLFLWRGAILGPAGTAFADALLQVVIAIPESYPAVPPTISFAPQHAVFHPNVTLRTGEICLDVLKEAWSPVWTLESCCFAIQALLGSGEAKSPLNVDAANLLRCGDQVGYESLVRMYLSL